MHCVKHGLLALESLVMRIRTASVLYRSILLACCLSATMAHAQFSLTVAPSPLTLQTGHHSTETITLTSTANNWSGGVAVACTNLPVYATCKFPSLIQTFQVADNAPTTATFTLNTSFVDGYENGMITTRTRGVELCLLLAPAICCVFWSGKRRKQGVRFLLLFLLAFLPLAGLTGCTGTQPPSTPPGTYNILIQGGGGGYAASATLVLTVTP